MAKTKCKTMNPKAIQALKAWRDGLPRDADGKIIYPARKSAAESLVGKKKKLADLLEKVEELKKDIAALDSRVHKDEKKKLFDQLTVEEMQAILVARSIKK